MSMGLVRYDKMVLAIAECHLIDEVKDIRDKLAALELYAKQAKNVDAERKACEIRLRAERRGGDILEKMQKSDKAAAGKAGGYAKAGTPNDAGCQESEYGQSLKSAGISSQTASRWQALARVPQQEFEAALRDPIKPTLTGIVKPKNVVKQMDDDALWIWGRLRDFERLRLSDKSVNELFDGMTETMQADMLRIAPMFIEWLSAINERK